MFAGPNAVETSALDLHEEVLTLAAMALDIAYCECDLFFGREERDGKSLLDINPRS